MREIILTNPPAHLVRAAVKPKALHMCVDNWIPRFLCLSVYVHEGHMYIQCIGMRGQGDMGVGSVVWRRRCLWVPLSGSFPPKVNGTPEASISVRTFPTPAPINAEEGREA